MSLSTIKNKFLNNKLQVLQVDKEGVVLESDNSFFNINKGTSIVDIHPFFYSILPVLSELKELINFPCVNFEINDVEKIIDIQVQKLEDEIFITIIDFTKHYQDSHPLVQEKNEASIAKNKLTFEKELLYAKEDFKNSFLAHLNHEIRNPLNSLLGFTDILAQTNLTFQQKETLNVIKRTGTHIKILMDDLLDISKIETGVLTLKNIPFNLNNIVVNIIKHFQIKQQSSAIDLSYQIEKDTPIKLYGDPTRLNQILDNLLQNAYYYTEKGSIKLIVENQPVEENNDLFIFRVIDTGKGILNKNLDKIFDSYIQLEVEKLKPLGQGLGLKIVQDLALLMGGKVSATSEIDMGSEFRVEIPFKTRESNTKKKRTVPKGSGLLLTKRVLAVEDDEINQMLLMKQFLSEDTGYYLEIVTNGEQTKQALEKKKYDAILLKRKLKDINGLDLIDYIRKHPNDKIAEIPIIVASGMAMIVEQEETLAAGASAFLKKPYTQKELFTLLESV